MKKNVAIVMFLSLTMAAVLFVSPVLAEGTIHRIEITSLDYEHFPAIVVQAIIRDENNDPVPSGDLNPDQGNIELLEDGEPVEYSFQQITSGTETLVVIDPAIGSEKAKLILQEMADSLQTGDSMGIILANSQESQFVRTLTMDRQAIQKSVNDLDFSNTGERLTNLNGVLMAYDALKQSLNYKKMAQSVVFISSALHSVQPDDITGITTKAGELNAPLHVLSDGTGTYASNQLIRLAENTKGVFVNVSSDNALSSLLNWLNQQRIQYQFVYQTQSSSTSDRTVELRTKSGAAGATASYQIDVKKPIVVIDSPANNVEYVREADTYEIGQTAMEGVEPTEVKVLAHIEWPDGYPRKIKWAQFMLNNEPTDAPTPYPGDQFEFTWDLRQYRSEGENSAQLRIKVQDELGLESISDAVNVQVTVIIPPPPSQSAIVIDPFAQCDDNFDGFEAVKCKSAVYAQKMLHEPSGWIAIISLIIAIVAVVFSIRFKGQIVQGAGAVYENVRETITRLTRAGGSEIGAYLDVLRGDDYLVGQSIPLYLRTVTPVGRDPQQSEIVFQANEERSIISRKHCEFREEDGVFYIRDIGSSHGTYVNGVRIPEGGKGQELMNGDKIEVGSVARGGVLLQFKVNSEQLPSSESASSYDEDNIYDTNPAYSDDDLEYDYDASDW